MMHKHWPSPFRAILPKGRMLALGLTLSVLVLVGASLMVHFLPGASRAANVAYASGGGGGGCSTTTGPVCTMKGTTATAQFDSVTACIQTSSFVQASADVTHNPPNPQITGTTLFVELFQFDFCNGVPVQDVFGQLSGVNFQADTNLMGASVTASIPAFDSVSNTSVTISVNVTWQGIGATTTQVDSSHFRSPGIVINSHFIGTSRAAVVLGSISTGAASLAVPDSGGSGGGGGSFGELSLVKSGTVQIFH